MEKRHLTLKAKDNRALEGLLSKGSLTAQSFKRATALLELSRGKSFGAVAQSLGVCYQTVSSWCASYKEKGLVMLYDESRPGRPVEIDGRQRAQITALACSDAPEGHARWSLRLLADKAVELGYCEHLSHNHAGEILKKMN
jgi:putative transposase